MFKAKGKLIYDPKTDASKFNFWWAKVDVPAGIIRYYQHWVKNQLGLKLNTPIWKAHITVLRGEEPKNKLAWKKYQNQEIEFEYSPELKMSQTYVWIPVESPQLEAIRQELGLRPQPRVNFHITVGNTKNLEKVIEKVEAPMKAFPWEDVRTVDEFWRRPK